MVDIIGSFLMENVGIEDISGILGFLDKIDFEKGNFLMEIIGIFFLLFSVSALFNTLRFSINEFLDLEKIFIDNKKKILSTLKSRLVSVLLLTFFGLIVILTYFAQTVLISAGTYIFKDFSEIQQLMFLILEHCMAIFSNVIIFVLIFKFLHDGKVSWKFAFKGSIFTSILLYVGQLLIKFYITHYFFARNAGLAGTILILLVWMYYSSHIIFLGAKYMKVYADLKNKPIQID
jgi:membrane protein